MESRIGVIEGILRGLVVQIEAINARLDRLEARMDRLESRFDGLRTTIIITGVSSSIAIILGVGAINATVFNNMLAAFEGGKEVAQTQADIKRQTAELDQRLAQTQADMKRQAAELGKQLAATAALMDEMQRRDTSQRAGKSQAPSR